MTTRQLPPFLGRVFAGLLVLAATALARSAHADCAGSEGSAASDTACTIEAQCPDSGVACSAGDASCVDRAEAAGLAARCEVEEGTIYCHPDEQQAAAMSAATGRPLHAAGATFALAACITFVRARKRRR